MTATPVTIGHRRSLTPIQRALFASQQRDPRSPMQNMVHLCHIESQIDPDRLAASFASVVAASDVLRTQITTNADGETTVRLSNEPATTEVVSVPRDDAHAWARRRARHAIAIGRQAYALSLIHI